MYIYIQSIENKNNMELNKAPSQKIEKIIMQKAKEREKTNFCFKQ